MALIDPLQLTRQNQESSGDPRDRLDRWALVAFGTIGVVLGIAEMVGLLENYPVLRARTSAAILTVISLLAFYVATQGISMFRSIESIKKAVNADFETKLFLNADEAFSFLERLILTTNLHIDQVAIARTPNLKRSVLEDYRRAQNSFLRKPQAQYRYVVDPSYVPRMETLQRFLATYTVTKFHLRELSDHTGVTPSLNFFIFDKQTLFVRYPHEEWQRGVYLFIRDPNVVTMFLEYYERIWDRANEITVSSQTS